MYHYKETTQDEQARMLEGLSGFLLEHVLRYLSTRDYVQLSLTSTSLHHHTTEYLLHCAEAAARDHNIAQFFSRNHALLLPYERRLYHAYTRLPTCTHLPLYAELLRVLKDHVTRTSICTSQVFGYLGDKEHVYVEHSAELERDIVYLKEISWLLFRTNLPKLDVLPATYCVRLHLQVREGVVWKGDQPMTVRVQRCATHEIVRHNFIHPSVWRDLASGKEVNLDYNGYNDPNDFRIECTDTASWYFLVIDNIRVGEGEDLYFTLDDRRNVFWKSGKSWDYLEVVRVSDGGKCKEVL